MASYEPPTADYPIFDSLVFQSPNSASLTMAEGDQRYLARQNVATSVATATQFAGDVNVGNSQLDYTTGTGLTIKGTANGESIFMNVLSAGGVTKQKVELNPGHLHLYDAVRITDPTSTNYTTIHQTTAANCDISNLQTASSTITFKTRNSVPATVTPLQLSGTTSLFNLPIRITATGNNFTEISQTSGDCSIENIQSNSTSIALRTRTSGGVTVTPLQLSSTTSTFNLPITLTSTATPIAGQLGHSSKTTGTAVAASMTSATFYNLITAGVSVSAGTYSISIYVRISHTATAGSVQSLQIGFTNTNTGFGATGFNNNVSGSSTIPAVAGTIVGQLTETVTFTSTTTMYLGTILTFTTIVPTTVPGSSYVQLTRIA